MPNSVILLREIKKEAQFQLSF